MEDKGTLYLTGGTQIDKLFDLGITPLPGRGAIVMDKCSKRGEIYLPGSGRLDADTGVIAATGVPDLPVGTSVGILPYHGIYIDDWKKTGWDVRLFGVADPWYKSVVCSIHTDEAGNLRLNPTHDWCLIKRDKRESKVDTPDVSAWRDWRLSGVIVANGPRLAAPLEVGTRVHFKRTHMERPDEEDMVTFRFDLDESLALVRRKNLLAVEAA